MSRLIYISIFVFVISGFGFSRIVDIENEFIKIGVDDMSGRFTLQTTGGDPKNPHDRNQNLLFRKVPPSSVTTILIDGEPFIFGSDRGRFRRRADVVGNKIVSEWSVRGIEVIQEIGFIRNPATGREDAMRILYKIRNDNRIRTKVGVRILLDTHLGDSDGGAFRIPGAGDITKETEFYMAEVPEVFYSFDSLKDPKVRSQAILSGRGITRPQRVIFAGWDRLYDNLWDMAIDASLDFRRRGTAYHDSAAGIYYEPLELGYDDIMMVSSVYGLYSGEFFVSDHLSVDLSVPAEPKSPPIQIAANAMNKGNVVLDKLIFEIDVPQGFNLSEGQNRKVEFVKVEPNETKKALWHLRSGSISGNFDVNVKVTGIVDGREQFVTAKHSFKIDYTEDRILRDVAQLEDLERKVEERARERTEVVDTSTVETRPVRTTTPPVETVVAPPSEAELALIREIEELDRLIEDVDKKYRVLIEVYRKSYVQGTELDGMDNEIERFRQHLLRQEIILSNQKAKLREGR
jgi:hypothetical protein